MLGVKNEPPAAKESKSEEKETVFKCLYTNGDFCEYHSPPFRSTNRYLMTSFLLGLAITFSLQTYQDIDERGDLVSKCLYTPLELDKLQPGVVAKLDYFAKPFTFDPSENGFFLGFLRTMGKYQVMCMQDEDEE